MCLRDWIYLHTAWHEQMLVLTSISEHCQFVYSRYLCYREIHSLSDIWHRASLQSVTIRRNRSGSSLHIRVVDGWCYFQWFDAHSNSTKIKCLNSGYCAVHRPGRMPTFRKNILSVSSGYKFNSEDRYLKLMQSWKSEILHQLNNLHSCGATDLDTHTNTHGF
jgi:hypothetical protein